MSKRALGKGLDALLQSGDEPIASGASIEQLPVEQIKAGSFQPRKDFDDATLEELADSIRSKGVLQPVLVERTGGGYALVAGERRYRAAKIAGLKQIPALIGSYSDEEKLQIALIENVQREDLNPIEEAAAYSALLKQSGASQEELAEKIGKKRSTVANALRLLKLPESMQQELRKGTLSAGHARAILSVTNPADQQILFERIQNLGLSVREAETQAEELNRGKRGPGSKGPARTVRRDPELQDMEQRLIERLGTKVRLKGSARKGSIEISYFSSDDLERVLELLSGKG